MDVHKIPGGVQYMAHTQIAGSLLQQATPEPCANSSIILRYLTVGVWHGQLRLKRDIRVIKRGHPRSDENRRASLRGGKLDDGSDRERANLTAAKRHWKSSALLVPEHYCT